jgi:methionyl-tRNA synthetase
MAEKFYVTTPIYYVNDKPHIGHAYTTILADCLSRYHRLQGVPTFFLTGTDEHGQKVKQAAEKAGLTPQAQADRTVVRFQELWEKLGITQDDFIRTTETRHTVVVQQILQDLFDRNEIYRAEYDGWYCVPCERFFTAKDLQDGNCPDCGRPAEKITEANYFFKMGRYRDWLVEYIHAHPAFIQPESRRNETLGFLRNTLNDLCISRPKHRMSWGIELPFDREFVTYVWFDALVNYISAVGYRADDKKFNQWWPASCHLIGKDILTTHTVYWPTMLKAMGVPLPDTIFAHGWWLMGDKKMSKSTGNVVNPLDFAEKFGTDAFRYFLMAEMTPGQDAGFTEEAFIKRYNADLANDLGNLLNRVMKLIENDCAGTIPASGPAGTDEQELQQAAQRTVKQVQEAIAGFKLNAGIDAVTGMVRLANQYLEKKQPWTLAKKGDHQTLETVLYTAAEIVRIASGLLAPIMPAKMLMVWRLLGIDTQSAGFTDLQPWGQLRPGTRIGAMQVLFPRITARPADAVPAAPTAPANDLVEIDLFRKIKLRVATILSAEKVSGADKILKLQIQVGDEKRQLVAGIAQYYQPADLVGREIVVVANLKPAVIRGIESQGMLLAAKTKDGKLTLVRPDQAIGSGAEVS